MAPKGKTAANKGAESRWTIQRCYLCNSNIEKLADSVRVLRLDYEKGNRSSRFAWAHRKEIK